MFTRRPHILALASLLSLASVSGCALVDSFSGEDDDDSGDLGGNGDLFDPPRLCFTATQGRSCSTGSSGEGQRQILIGGETSTVTLYLEQYSLIGAVLPPQVSFTVASLSPSPVGIEVRLDPPVLSPGDSARLIVKTTSASRGLHGFRVEAEGTDAEVDSFSLVLLVGRPGELGRSDGPVGGGGLALSPDGQTLLVSECVPFEPSDYVTIDRLVQIDPSTLRAARTVVPELPKQPCTGSQCTQSCPVVAFESASSALMGARRLNRVDLSRGTVTPIGEALLGPISRIAVLPGARAALLLLRPDLPATSPILMRVDLSSGTSSLVVAQIAEAHDFALEADGQSIIVISSPTSGGMATFKRIRLDNQQTTVIRSADILSERFILEPDGRHAITASLARIELRSGGAETRLAGRRAFWGRDVVREPGGGLVTLIATGSQTSLPGRLERLVPAEIVETIHEGSDRPTTLAVSATHAFFGFNNQLRKLDLSTLEVTSVDLPGFGGSFTRLLPDGDAHALAVGGGSSGSLYRIDLASGAAQEITVGVPSRDFVSLGVSTFLMPDPTQNQLLAFDAQSGNLAMISGGFESYIRSAGEMPQAVSLFGPHAYVGGNGPVHRVHLTSRVVENLQHGPLGGRMAVLPEERILSADDAGTFILDLRSGARSRLRLPGETIDFALEAGGETALLLVYRQAESTFALLRVRIPAR